MNETNLMDYIPPEQIGLIIIAIVGLIVAFFGALAYLIKWGVDYWTRVQEVKLKKMQQEIDNKKAEIDSQRRIDELKIQKQLDETQSNREKERLWFDALAEERKDNAEQRKAFERREAIHIEAMQGIQNNTAATLGILKEMSDRLSKHQESDETMEIKQEKLIAQNDKTHSQNEETHERLSTMAGVIDAIVVKLDNITATKKGDEKVLQDIHKLLSELKESFQRLESSPVATPVTKSDTQVAPEIQENQKELKKEDSQ